MDRKVSLLGNLLQLRYPSPYVKSEMLLIVPLLGGWYLLLMDDSKPRPKEYIEGPEAAKQFEVLVKKAVTVPRSEIQKRHKEWEKERKQQKRVSRS